MHLGFNIILHTLIVTFLDIYHVFRHQETNPAPGEIKTSDRQSAVTWQRKHTVKDVVVFPLGLRDFPQEIGGIKLGPVNHNSASLSHNSS